MLPIYTETKSLPPTLQSALRSVGHARPTIAIYASETASMSSASGDGMRAFTVLVDIDSGRSESHIGDWGGSNPFHASPVDGDTASRPLPPNGAVIHGHQGGGKPVYASLTVHPTRIAKLLPSPVGEALTARQTRLLGVYAHLNSRGRKEWFDRHSREFCAPTIGELADLERTGLIKVNKAGSVTITPAGRNAADREVGY